MTLQVALLAGIAVSGVHLAVGSVQTFADEVAHGLVDSNKATPFGEGWNKAVTELTASEVAAVRPLVSTPGILRAINTLAGGEVELPNPCLLDDYQSHTNYTTALSGGSASTVAATSAGGRVQIVSASANTTTMSCTRTTALTYAGNKLGVIAAAVNFSGANSSVGLRLGTSETKTHFDTAAPQKTRRGLYYLAFHCSEFPTFFADTSLSARQVQLFAALGSNAGVTTATFGPIWYNAGGKASIMLTFDDCFASQYTRALPILSKYGLVGNIYLPSAIVATTAARLTLANLTEMRNAGWAICADSTPNDAITDFVDQVAAVNGLNVVRQYLLNNNLSYDGSENHGCWTNGLFTPSVQPYDDLTAGAFAKAGMRSMRTTNSIPQFDRFGLGDQAMTVTSYSANAAAGYPELLAALDTAELRGSSQSFHFHSIVESGATGNDQNAPVLDAFCAELAARVAAGRIEVVTRPQWWRRVSVSTPPAIPF